MRPTTFETNPFTRAYYAQRKSELTGLLAGSAISVAIRSVAKAMGKLDRDGRSATIEYTYASAVAGNVAGYTVTRLLRKRGW